MIFRHLLNMRSHPTWVRGLKLLTIVLKNSLQQSHPTWVRGLKHRRKAVSLWCYCRTLRGCVD